MWERALGRTFSPSIILLQPVQNYMRVRARVALRLVHWVPLHVPGVKLHREGARLSHLGACLISACAEL